MSGSHAPTLREAVILLFMGIISLGIAIFNRKFFWRKGWFSGDQPAPRWVGAVIFGLVGIAFILVSLTYLLSGK
jgi:hypothetical protein